MKEPPQKKRRSNAATDSGCDVLKTLQAEISQRPWDVAGTSENLEKQLVEIVMTQIQKDKKEEALACPARRSRSRRHPD